MIEPAKTVALTVAVVLAATLPAAEPVVEVEEDVYSFTPANNGAGPMWCSGSTTLIRDGELVFATGLETLTNTPPLNNCRWTLWRRDGAGWAKVYNDGEGRTREPSPIVRVGGGTLLVSANPTLAPVGQAGGGPARPELVRFDAASPARPSATHLPKWAGSPKFTEHSYRSFVADPATGDFAWFQNVDYAHAEWVLGRLAGEEVAWRGAGQLRWPRGTDYPRPQPIRICYPNVALAGVQLHFVGVSDIIEPNPEWRAFKKQLTGQEWDYDFRRLFYVWSKDLASGQFEPWLELASREQTCGWITPGDLYLAPDGLVHIVWTERAIDERLRARFFPEAKQRHELNYARLREGKILARRTLLAAEEGGAREVPGLARFHVTPEGRLYVFHYVSGTNAEGRPISENRLLELRADGRPGETSRVPLKQPFTSFFTATPRAGASPSPYLDLLGQRAGAGQTISYARVKMP
jgi:hypothetical protein